MARPSFPCCHFQTFPGCLLSVEAIPAETFRIFPLRVCQWKRYLDGSAFTFISYADVLPPLLSGTTRGSTGGSGSVPDTAFGKIVFSGVHCCSFPFLSYPPPSSPQLPFLRWKTPKTSLTNPSQFCLGYSSAPSSGLRIAESGTFFFALRISLIFSFPPTHPNPTL